MEREGERVYPAIPSPSPPVSLRRMDELTIVKLSLKDDRFEFAIIEGEEPMALMTGKMIHERAAQSRFELDSTRSRCTLFFA